MKLGKNPSYLREINNKTILNLIRRNPVSRSDIARITGLTKPAVSAIVENLINTGLVESIGREDISRGRRPDMLSLRSGTHYSIGINILRDGCVTGFCDLTGKVRGVIHISISDLPPVIAVKKICGEIRIKQEELRIADDMLLGIGISIPGPVDTVTGTILNPPNFTSWHNFNIVESFKHELNVPTLVENNATSYALAETLYGSGGNYENYFMFVFTDGVGTSQIINGKPYRGQMGINPEIGHVSIDINGRQCACGNKGCLELYTSIPAIVAKAKSEGLNVSSWNDIVDMALNQNKQCLNIIKTQAEYLAFSIENINNMFIPEAVFLSGKIIYKPELLLSFIKNKAFQKTASKSFPIPRILISAISENNEVLTAASIVFTQLLFS